MEDVTYSTDDAIATLTLDRPEARNAYSSEMAGGVVDALDAAEADSDVSALVITGKGDAFSAGGDLKAMKERSGMFAGDATELRRNYMEGLQRVPRRFNTFEKPVIAAINGPAIGAGLDLALMCDIRIAAEDAKFGSTFAKVGLIPGDGGAYLLTRIVGFPKAVELILTARVIDADEALDIDLVNRLVPRDEVLDEATSMARRIASLPDKAVQAAKATLYQSVDNDLETSLQLTAAMQGCVQSTEDHDRAVDELLESLRSD